MKRFNIKHLIALLGAGLLWATAATATEDATWGQVKNSDDALASKHVRTTDSTSLDTYTATSLDAYTATSLDAGYTTATAATATDTEILGTDAALVKPNKRETLFVADLGAQPKSDDLQVWLNIPQRAVTEDVLITMTVSGQQLSELVIAFEPGGLVFEQPAELIVLIGQDRVDIDTQELKIWHQYSDGTVEETVLIMTQTIRDDYFEFRAVVPGFSRYGLW